MAYTSIDDPSAYFHTQLYTGDGNATQAITNNGNSDLQPDWLWIKRRSDSEHHMVADSNRGAGKRLRSNSDDVEDDNGVTSFNTDGFTTLSSAVWNASSETYVAWQWKANGGTTASNSNGGVTSTVQANTTAGFSIVTWTGDGSDETVGHGLSSAPELFIIKNREDSTNWRIGQDIVTGKKMTDGNGYYMELDDTKASTNPGSAVTWGSTPTAPTSSVFTVGSNNAHNGSSDDFVAYCFHSVQGYSKIGTYTGNGNADGPFVYTGFKPAWVLIKRTDSSAEWHMWDNKREDYNGNPNDTALRANNNNAESDSTDYSIDFLSNGFKVRNASNLDNASSSTQIYMAFAEHPFVSSEGVPCTAR